MFCILNGRYFKMDVNDITMNMDDYMRFATQLRSKDKIVEIYSKKSNIKKQMIYANKKKVKFVVIFGETEADAKNIIIKNMEDGSQEQVDIDKLLDFI